MTIIELINDLKIKLNDYGNLDVKILYNGDFSDVITSKENDVIDIGNGEYVPVPILLINSFDD